MRFIILFKKLFYFSGTRRKPSIDLSLQYEDEDYIIYADERVESSDDFILLGYKTYGDGGLGFREGGWDLFELDRVYDGKYLAVDLVNKQVFVDPLGLQYVYVCDSAVASDIRLIRDFVGCGTLTLLPPGKIFSLSFSGGRLGFEYSGRVIRGVDIPRECLSSIDAVSEVYHLLVREKVRAILEYVNASVKDVYISFSGGVDSSIIAKLCSEFMDRINLVTVCVKDSFDDRLSRVSAELLGLGANHIVHHVGVSNVAGLLKEVVSIIGDWRLMQVSLAIPLYIVLKYYAGGNVLLMGQGSDEMFGGYKKYLDVYMSRGKEDASREMMLDIYLSYRNNFCREQKLADALRCRLYYPLLTPASVILALNSPMEYKIRSGSDELRKWIIRMLAARLGLPNDIVYRRKKALQYSSRVQYVVVKALGKRYRDVLYDMYRNVFAGFSRLEGGCGGF